GARRDDHLLCGGCWSSAGTRQSAKLINQFRVRIQVGERNHLTNFRVVVAGRACSAEPSVSEYSAAEAKSYVSLRTVAVDRGHDLRRPHVCNRECYIRSRGVDAQAARQRTECASAKQAA